jgi:nucleotide-binding universal stress UspA family protein
MRVLFAYDGSPFAKRALRYAGHLRPELEATVITVSTVLIEAPRSEEQTDPARDAQQGRRHLQEAREVLAGLGFETELVHEFGNPAAEILAAAEERGTELIVIGKRGRSAIARFVDGSVADRVARHASCDVLIVR